MKTRRTLQDVRNQLRKARLADSVSVQLTLQNAWRPLMWWRGFQFLRANRRRQRLLESLSRRSMALDWKCSLPRKEQRRIGMLPPLTPNL